MTELVKYEAARRALAEAVAVDEVLEIRGQSEALRHYARQAGDRELEIQAAQIRFRAERRLGELIVLQKETVGLNAGSRGQLKGRDDSGGAVSEQPEDARPTLAEAGIDRKLSSRAQKVAALDLAEFEAALARHAEEMRAGQGRIAMDLHKVGSEDRGREHRRNLAQALSEASAELPAGRQFPAAYIDCPWQRKGGIGDRAYENHYPTMTWPKILAFLRRARGSLLPDSWAFFWIPRAHLLALVEVEIEVEICETGEIALAKVMMPLGWAVGQALGMDSYSTCFVWTKTNEDHPDVSGSGLIAWDQDELLLLFKRGRGLPKPSGAEKYGSNHRERATDHSRKPEHYRKMIADMVGGLPVLEMFARVDADHPLPPGWEACGNQAGAPAPIAIGVDMASGPDLHAELEVGLDAGGRVIVNQVNQLAGLSPPGDVTAAAETSRASAAAVVTETAFPATELADLAALAADDPIGDRLLGRVEAYARRGLATDALGRWRLTGAGKVRLDVVTRDRADREAVCKNHLDQSAFCEWLDLVRVAGEESLDGASVRSLVGLDLAHCTTDRVLLTEQGRARLDELEAIVDRAAPTPDLAPPAPRQIDLEDLLAVAGDAPVADVVLGIDGGGEDDGDGVVTLRSIDLPLFLPRGAS